VGFDQPRTILPNGFAADIAVPAWAKFMKAATQRDEPGWIVPPAGVVTATVCRISGKLASEECRDAEVVNKYGELERKSTVYTEFFVRGTEPTVYCDAHEPRGVMTKIADYLGGQQQPAAPHAVDRAVEPAAAPPTPTATTGTTVPPGTTGTTIQQVDSDKAPPAKRSFWWRLLGRGRNRDNEPPKEEPPPRRPGGQDFR